MLCRMENSAKDDDTLSSNVYICDAMHAEFPDIKNINESLPKVSVYTMIQILIHS